jgi:PhzF family phenazine biosynthesis protein
MRIALVDAFTRNPGSGNRAGVVLDAAGLTDQQMQDAARAVGASETAFVLAGMKLRYFTPTTEVPFCGHATVATFHQLKRTGVIGFECPAGRLQVEVSDRIWIEPPIYDFSALDDSLYSVVGGQRDAQLPAERCGRFALLPIATRRELFALRPRWEDLVASSRERGLSGILVFTRDTIESGNVSCSRFFAPGSGIPEDPVTGSVHGPLAAYLARHGILRGRGRAEQGDAMGKPGRLELEVGDRVRVGGEAVTVIEGELVTS